MTSKRQMPFIGVRMQENHTPTGRRTATPARHAALYYAFGRDKAAQLAGRQRGEWLGPDGRVQAHEAVMAWTRQEALRHRFTFEALLSVPRGDLPPEAFCRAMQQGSQITDWRLITHRDTNYRHAHVLFFRDKRMDKQSFQSWQEAVRAELAGLEARYPSVELGTDMAGGAAQRETALEAVRRQTQAEQSDLSDPTGLGNSSKLSLSRGRGVGFG